jgi:hypothetical protein
VVNIATNPIHTHKVVPDTNNVSIRLLVVNESSLTPSHIVAIDPMSSNNAVAGSSPYALPVKKKRNKWLWIGLPILLIAIIVGAVVGGVVGSQHHSSTNTAASSSGTSNGGGGGGSGSTNSNAGAGSTATGANGNNDVYLAVATDTYFLPEYGTAVSDRILLFSARRCRISLTLRQ